MKEKYCDINYRGYLLEILQNEYVPGKFNYKGSSRDRILFLASPYTVIQIINKFISKVDSILGSREIEEEILFCTVIYQKYELGIWVKDDLFYMAWIDNFNFASWGENLDIDKLVDIIEAFRVKVDSGTGEDLVQCVTEYKGYNLIIRKKKDSHKYIGISNLLEGKWRSEGYITDFILRHFKYSVEALIKENKMRNELTFEEVCHEWGSSYKKITYKNQVMEVCVIKRIKDKKAFYIGVFSYIPQNEYRSKSISIESVHYNKVISKFERFVDEYCIVWQANAEFTYKGYLVKVYKDRDREFYLGTTQFHKDSTFKHIADTREEVERRCENRIDRVVCEKEKIGMTIQQTPSFNSKQEKIQELEQLLAKVSIQLEELKKEKDILVYVYKGVTLEVSKSNSGSYHGTLKDIPEPAPFVASNVEELQKLFESYVDRLEGCYLLFCRLTGREVVVKEKR